MPQSWKALPGGQNAYRPEQITGHFAPPSLESLPWFTQTVGGVIAKLQLSRSRQPPRDIGLAFSASLQGSLREPTCGQITVRMTSASDTTKTDSWVWTGLVYTSLKAESAILRLEWCLALITFEISKN